MLILFEILHVETMFGNEGEGFLHACISSIIWYNQPYSSPSQRGVSPGRGLLIPHGSSCMGGHLTDL